MGENSEPIILEVKCKHCGVLLNPIALDGLEVNNIQCPICERWFTIEAISQTPDDTLKND